MSDYQTLRLRLAREPRRWLVTGCAGFIGSHLVQHLLALGQHVTGLDSLATGHERNLDDVRATVGDEGWERFRFLRRDIRDLDACREACEGAELVLHQAALGSVALSIDDPLLVHQANVDGFVNMLVAARDAGAARFVYAASSATYGDDPRPLKVEDEIGRALSPYAVTKHVNELYAAVFERTYGLPTVGLRYFNVFGPRQDPEGAYAAVIPCWVAALLSGEDCAVHGDGETTRDFCYVDDVVQANLLAACARAEGVTGGVYNVASGTATTLNELFALIRDAVAEHRPGAAGARAEHGPFRPGDVRHSRADISRIRDRLGYRPAFTVREGMAHVVRWYARSPYAAPAGAAR